MSNENTRATTDERYEKFLDKYSSLVEGYAPIRGIARDYDGYVLNVCTHHEVYDEDGDLVEDNFEVERIEFGDAHELEAYCLEHELVANDREDYQINEWPDGTWLIIDAEHADYVCY